MNAAMMISRIMPLTRAVEMKQVRSTSQVSLPGLPDEEQRRDHAQRRAFGGGGDAEVQAAHHDAEHHQRRDQETQACAMRSAIGTGGSRMAFPLIRLDTAMHSMKQPVSSSPG